MNTYDYIGLVGVVLVVYCYARLQWCRDYAKQLEYSVSNFIGAVLVATSLTDKWNLAAFIVNTVMAVISAYGIFRCLKYYFMNKRQQREQAISISPR